MVLRRWESETWKFGFIKRVEEGRITTVKDLQSLRFERYPFVSFNGGNSTFISSSLTTNQTKSSQMKTFQTLSFGERGKPKYPEKTSQGRVENQQTHTKSTYSVKARIEPRLHWRKASARMRALLCL